MSCPASHWVSGFKRHTTVGMEGGEPMKRVLSMLSAAIVSAMVPMGTALAQMDASQGAMSSQIRAGSRIEGSIQSLDLKAKQPKLQLTDSQGQLITFNVDRKDTTVFQDGRLVKLDALQVGQQITVSPVEKNGQP